MLCSVKDRCFCWEIKNFYMFPILPGEAVCSPKFSFDSQGFINFHLYLYPKGARKSADSDYVSVYFVRDGSDQGPKYLYVDFKFTLYDSKSVRTGYSFSRCGRFERGSKHGCHNFFPRKTSFGRDLLQNDFCIKCEFAVADDEGETFSPWLSNDSDLECLSSDFCRSFEDGKYCDLFLRSSDNVLIKANKAVVLGRFPGIIERLGTYKTGDNEMSVKTNACTLHALLSYLYTGKLNQESSPKLSFESLYDSKLLHLEKLICSTESTAYATTTVDVKMKSLTWIVPLLKKVSTPTSRYKKLFRFNESTVFVILLDVGNYSDKDFAHFSMQAICLKTILLMKCRIQLYNMFGKPVLKQDIEGEHYFDSDKLWNIPFPIEKETLNDSIFPDDNIQIALTFEISDSELQTTSNVFHASLLVENELKVNFWALQEDFKGLYLNSNYYDVIIYVGEKNFHAHKFVLSARSSVFSELLKGETQNDEKVADIILKDLDCSTIDSLLLYVYCGELIELSQDIEHAIKLHEAAERFQLDRLKQKCFSYISHYLKADNVEKILPLVSKSECLMKLVKSYMYENAYEILYSLELSRDTDISLGLENISKDLQFDVLLTVLIHTHGKMILEGEVELSSAIKLYEYANKHHLLQLKKVSLSFLFHVLKPENICDLLALKLENNDENFKTQLRKFVHLNIDAIIQSMKWKEIILEKTGLIDDIQNINLRSKILSPEVIFHLLAHACYGIETAEENDAFLLALLYFETRKYKLPPLRKKFAAFIKKRITPQNAGNIAVIAHKYNDRVLKECILDFIRANDQKIFKSQGWRIMIKKLQLIEDLQVIAAAPRLLKSEIIMLMLIYIYSGLPNKDQYDLDFVMNLYIDSSKFHLMQVKKSCALSLKQAMNAENIGQILTLAYRHEDEQLVKYIQEYVSSNVEGIVKSNEFRSKIVGKLGCCVYNQIIDLSLQSDEVITMLSYLYSEVTDYEKYDLDRVIKMYAFANKYSVFQMENECNSFFKRVISLKNVGIFITLSDKYNDNSIENYARDFISSNKCEILKSNDWKVKVEGMPELSEEFSVDAESISSSIVFDILRHAHTGSINKERIDMGSLTKLYE